MELVCVDDEGFRRVNHREAAALIYTFEVEVGKFLIDTIRIEYEPTLPPPPWSWFIGDNKVGHVPPFNNTTKIQIRSDYNPETLHWLGTFVHEAVHIWQTNTWLNIKDPFAQIYTYSESQLDSIDDLGLEAFATVVQDWFYVNYGAEICPDDGDKDEITDWVWDGVNANFEDKSFQRTTHSVLEHLQSEVNPKYQEVLDRIRKPKQPRVIIEVPTPFPLDHPSDDEQFGVGAAGPDPTSDPFSPEPERESEPITRIHGPRFDVSIPPATQTGFRRVNRREAVALVYTFGGEVGSSLIGAIEIATGSADLTGSKTRMILPSNHSPKDLLHLGEFIRKAARIWQQRTGRHATGPQWTAEGEVGEDYYHTHLQSLNLNSRQHAAAVRDWFHASYGPDYCLLSTDAKQWPKVVREPIIRAAGFEGEAGLEDELVHPDLALFVKDHYAGLIEELRDPEVGQNAPYPAG